MPNSGRRLLSISLVCLIAITLLASSALATNLWNSIDDPYGVKAILSMKDPANPPRIATGAPLTGIPDGATVVLIGYTGDGKSALVFVYNGEYYFIGAQALTPILDADGQPVRDPAYTRGSDVGNGSGGDTSQPPEILEPRNPLDPPTDNPENPETNGPQATLNLAPIHGYRPRLADGAGEPIDTIPDGATVTVTHVEECEDGTTVTYFTYDGQEYWMESEFVNLIEG